MIKKKKYIDARKCSIVMLLRYVVFKSIILNLYFVSIGWCCSGTLHVFSLRCHREAAQYQERGGHMVAAGILY